MKIRRAGNITFYENTVVLSGFYFEGEVEGGNEVVTPMQVLREATQHPKTAVFVSPEVYNDLEGRQIE